MIHQFTSPPDTANGQAATEDFAQADQIGSDMEQLGGAAGRDSKAGYHFIEYEKRAILLRQFAQSLKEPVLWRNNAHVGCHWFDYDGGYLGPVSVECIIGRPQIVVRQRKSQSRDFIRHSRAGG
jgi:hypothetical protein